jgi:hypothetical protein
MEIEPTQPIVTDHPDGYRVEWPGYRKAFALFSVQGTSVVVTDIFRDDNQPKGSAGQMLADAFRAKGITRPLRVRLANILSRQPTLTALAAGTKPEDTILGNVLTGLATALGLRVASWNHGEERGKPFLEAYLGN